MSRGVLRVPLRLRACCRATGSSKMLLWACCEATRRSRRLLRACCRASGRELTSNPLCVRSHCLKSLFDITVREAQLHSASHHSASLRSVHVYMHGLTLVYYIYPLLELQVLTPAFEVWLHRKSSRWRASFGPSTSGSIITSAPWLTWPSLTHLFVVWERRVFKGVQRSCGKILPLCFWTPWDISRC